MSQTANSDKSSRTLSPLIAASLPVGAVAYLYPFFVPSQSSNANSGSHSSDAPILFAVLTLLCLAAAVSELGNRGNSKKVALLGALVALNAALRLFPSILGASPIFALIILVGYVYGPDDGFLMGSLTLLVSALITGGIGPWLPYQMLGAGWIGLLAGFLPNLRGRKLELPMLLGYGAIAGLAFGALLNLWFWPFTALSSVPPEDAALYWTPGLGAGETLSRYLLFYAITSFVYDLFRSLGNVLLITLFGPAVVKMLRRYQSRFTWHRVEVFQREDAKTQRDAKVL